MLMLYRKRWVLCYLPVASAALLAIYILACWVFPLPPRSLALGVGVPQGGFAQLGARYRDELERRGIAVDIVSSSAGATGPLQHLAAPGDRIQAGFAHGLLAQPGSTAPVQALAVVGRQPLWIFTRHANLTSIGMARGMRIAAGPPDSTTRAIASLLLAQVQVRPAEVTWVDPQGMGAANELLEQRADFMITIGSSDAPTVRLLSRSPGIFMLGLDRADLLAAREPRLHPFVLPQGTIELRGDVPPRDLTLLYTGTHLLVREGMHPALQRALLDAATEIHAMPSALQRQSEYPDFQSDFRLSPVAQRYAIGQRPWLETMLPYWWAQLAELLLYAILPVVLVAIASLIWIPRFFSLRVDALLSHYYGELKFLERDFDEVATETPIRLRDVLGKLDQMEYEISALDLPARFADRWYTLRHHLATARDRLLDLRAR